MVSRILFYNIKNNKNPNKVAMMIRDARSDIIDAQSDIRYIWTRIRATKKHYKFEYEIAKLIIFYNRIDIVNTRWFATTPDIILLSFKQKNFKMLDNILGNISLSIYMVFEYIDSLYYDIKHSTINNSLFTYINNDDIFQLFEYIIFNYKFKHGIYYQKDVIESVFYKNYFWISESQMYHLANYIIENPKMKKFNKQANNEKLLFYSAIGAIHELEKLLKIKKN